MSISRRWLANLFLKLRVDGGQLARAVLDELIQVQPMVFQLRFGLLAAGDVADEQQELVCRPPEGDADLDVHDPAVLPAVPALKTVEAALHHGPDVPGCLLRRLDRLDIGDVQLQEFFTGVAAHPAVGVVDVQQLPVGVKEPEPIRRSRQQGGILVGLELESGSGGTSGWGHGRASLECR